MNRSSATSLNISDTMIGAKPSEGSSSRSSGGLAMSPRATASICRWSPERSEVAERYLGVGRAVATLDEPQDRQLVGRLRAIFPARVRSTKTPDR